MAERRIIPIPFGEGLERSDGVMVVRPTSFADLRNVYQYEGKAQARRGLTETDRLIDDLGADLDRTLALGPIRAENAAIGVGQNVANDDIWVNRLTVAGMNAQNIGLFGQLGVGVTFNPPIIILADSDNKCFIAHDEPNVNARLVTKYYDPLAFPQLVELEADLDGDGPALVYFRGVVRHLSYIFGWGYGSALEPDRIDVVRVSTGGNPTIFRDDAFFEVGQRGEPVMVCRPAGQFLMVFKETETYQIFGYSPDTFGIRPADTLFGCVSSRLAVSIAGAVFFWSVQGPRITTGGESMDIAVPLDLDGPDPSTLVAEADVQNAFAEYDPATRVVNFVWGRRVYALSIRNPNKPRWSYYELAETAQCGAQFFATQSTQGGGGQPADAPDFDPVPFTSITPTTAVAEWDNVGATGGEQIEVWARVAAGPGAWSQVGEFTYNGLASQSGLITGLNFQTTYGFALRYRRGGLYNPGAVGGDPAGWPAQSQAQGTTADVAPVPVSRGFNNGRWQRSAADHQILVQWTNPPGTESSSVEIWRRTRTEGDIAVQNVFGLAAGTEIGPPNTSDPAPGAFALLATVAPGTSYLDTAVTKHRWHDYQFRYVGSATFSSTLACWAGPDAPSNLTIDQSDPALKTIHFEWANASAPTGRTECPGPADPPNNHFTEAWANDATANPGNDGWTGPIAAMFPFDTDTFAVVTVAIDNSTLVLGIVHRVNCHSDLYNYSYWAPTAQAQVGTAEGP